MRKPLGMPGLTKRCRRITLAHSSTKHPLGTCDDQAPQAQVACWGHIHLLCAQQHTCLRGELQAELHASSTLPNDSWTHINGEQACAALTSHADAR